MRERLVNEFKEFLLENKKVLLIKIDNTPIPWRIIPTNEECLDAIDNNPFALRFIRHPTEEMCLKAVSRVGEALQHCRVQTPKVCLAALKMDKEAIYFIRNTEVRKLILETLKEEMNEKKQKEDAEKLQLGFNKSLMEVSEKINSLLKLFHKEVI